MSELSRAVAEGLCRAYQGCYDVDRVEDGSGLVALCRYFRRDSQFVAVRSAELWAAEQYEYLYLWDVGHLTADRLQTVFAQVCSDGEGRVRPHSQHMCTYLTAVVLYDRADADALAQLKKLKKRREYRFTLHGWMEVRIVAVDVTTAECTANRSGKGLKADLARRAAGYKAKFLGEERA